MTTGNQRSAAAHLHRSPSDQLDDTLTRIEGPYDGGKRFREGCDQCFVTAIPEPDPEKPPVHLGKVRQVQKILVLTDHDPVLSQSRRPQTTIIESLATRLEHVRRVMPAVAKPLGKRWRELVVDQEPHATSTTIWFVCRAA